MIDINELRLIVAEFRSAGQPMTIQASQMKELLDRLAVAEKERESWKGLAQQFGNELDALRAKIAEMERQEPVGRFARIDGDGPLMECKHADIPRVPLYALPGAKGE